MAVKTGTRRCGLRDGSEERTSHCHKTASNDISVCILNNMDTFIMKKMPYIVVFRLYNKFQLFACISTFHTIYNMMNMLRLHN